MRSLSLLLAVTLLFFYSCTGRDYITGDVKLRFSSDTIHFDTVFTSIGTATRELRVINENSGWVKVRDIYLPGRESSSFRLNVDGASGNSFSDVEIAPGDSIFIFIDLLVDPTSQDSPVLINDSIVFNLNGRVMDVNLVAWGQDIILINGEVVQEGEWNDTKPYVVYNSMMVDTGQTLIIRDGVRVLFHRGSTMYVAGSLSIEGSADNPVIFASDRTEREYDDIPGQWEGIYFVNGSINNSINFLELSGAVSGIHLGNLGTPDPPPDLQLYNTRIEHNTVSGLSSLGGTVTAGNLVINHCGFYGIFLAAGGSYSFTHCTVNGYWDYSIRVTPALYISDFVMGEGIAWQGSLAGAEFRNSAISGSLQEEIVINAFDGSALNCSFEGCLMQIDETSPVWFHYNLQGNYINYQPGYIAAGNYNLVPDSLSVLTDNAIPAISLELPADIRGLSRFDDNGPDIGAYERQPGEKR